MMTFLMIGYLVNWWSDVDSFRGWNVPKGRGGFNPFGEGGDQLESEISNAVSAMKSATSSLEGAIDRLAKDKNIGSLDQTGTLTYTANRLANVVETFEKDAFRLNWTGLGLLLIWHGGIPVGLGASAIRVLMTSAI
ncbi:hypothetical protein EU805_09555 [Salipiger sp. IMCC34102]|uniref:hypothetical protein n=1 Tax=Salipiger sp. IMCC34102 TaxID=2510647 RepID=UPI00101E1F8B|nr:hypothetical protein [Salipiger sp. IMCC34102]RYH02831.1 hypothetical protein EU805_09555 [Salipiger sp. IMCC34102]